MLEIMLLLLLIVALFIVVERSMIRVVIYLGIFSLFSALIYLLLGSPDVAMAEAVISAFSTILFIVCIERYYTKKSYREGERKFKGKSSFLKYFLMPLILCVSLVALFIYFTPDAPVSTYLRDLYLLRAGHDIGGENVVGAIILGYRVYDTLFEALILVISVVAVSHLSWYEAAYTPDGRHSQIEKYPIAVFAMKMIAPMMLIFGVYLIANGHLSAGGGFQGGVAIASFFVCRYMVYNIYDMPIKKAMKIEEMLFILIAISAAFTVFIGIFSNLPARIMPWAQDAYLLMMNTMIGLKVACGFFLIFYRYIAIEKLESEPEKMPLTDEH